jgi:hypothetical protein
VVLQQLQPVPALERLQGQHAVFAAIHASIQGHQPGGSPPAASLHARLQALPALHPEVLQVVPSSAHRRWRFTIRHTAAGAVTEYAAEHMAEAARSLPTAPHAELLSRSRSAFVQQLGAAAICAPASAGGGGQDSIAKSYVGRLQEVFSQLEFGRLHYIKCLVAACPPVGRAGAAVVPAWDDECMLAQLRAQAILPAALARAHGFTYHFSREEFTALYGPLAEYAMPAEGAEMVGAPAARILRALIGPPGARRSAGKTWHVGTRVWVDEGVLAALERRMQELQQAKASALQSFFRQRQQQAAAREPTAAASAPSSSSSSSTAAAAPLPPPLPAGDWGERLASSAARRATLQAEHTLQALGLRHAAQATLARRRALRAASFADPSSQPSVARSTAESQLPRAPAEADLPASRWPEPEPEPEPEPRELGLGASVPARHGSSAESIGAGDHATVPPYLVPSAREAIVTALSSRNLAHIDEVLQRLSDYAASVPEWGQLQQHRHGVMLRLEHGAFGRLLPQMYATLRASQQQPTDTAHWVELERCLGAFQQICERETPSVDAVEAWKLLDQHRRRLVEGATVLQSIARRQLQRAPFGRLREGLTLLQAVSTLAAVPARLHTTCVPREW